MIEYMSIDVGRWVYLVVKGLRFGYFYFFSEINCKVISWEWEVEVGVKLMSGIRLKLVVFKRFSRGW